MPVHDWSRTAEAAYHSFQLDWVSALSTALNRGVLPRSHFAMTETIELRPVASFCVLPEPEQPVSRRKWYDDVPELSAEAPRTTLRIVDDRRQYACRIVTVRDDLHQPAAAVLFVTQQDKQTAYRLRTLVQFVVGAVTRGIHVLIVDLFPPSVRDPQGIHKAIWDEFADEPFELPAGKTRTLVAYQAASEIVAYIEPVAVGDTLPDMPLFLEPDAHVLVPLEATYAATWAVCPEPIRELVETPPAA